MAYVDSILEPGETVRYHTTVSWTIYTPAILLALAALAALLAAFSAADLVNIGWFAAVVFGLGAIVAAVLTGLISLVRARRPCPKYPRSN